MYAMRPYKNLPVCIKEYVGRCQISVSFDDSCGMLHNYERGDIRVYNRYTGVDMTELITKETIIATIENLTRVYHWCELYSENVRFDSMTGGDELLE
jgi:hypothetical protein